MEMLSIWTGICAVLGPGFAGLGIYGLTGREEEGSPSPKWGFLGLGMIVYTLVVFTPSFFSGELARRLTLEGYYFVLGMCIIHMLIGLITLGLIIREVYLDISSDGYIHQ